MKPGSNLAALIERYFTERLMRHRDVSPHTVASYPLFQAFRGPGLVSIRQPCERRTTGRGGGPVPCHHQGQPGLVCRLHEHLERNESVTGPLQSTPNKRLVVVGCSVGASCALEIAVAASERVGQKISSSQFCRSGNRLNHSQGGFFMGGMITASRSIQPDSQWMRCGLLAGSVSLKGQSARPCPGFWPSCRALSCMCHAPLDQLR